MKTESNSSYTSFSSSSWLTLSNFCFCRRHRAQQRGSLSDKLGDTFLMSVAIKKSSGLYDKVYYRLIVSIYDDLQPESFTLTSLLPQVLILFIKSCIFPIKPRMQSKWEEKRSFNSADLLSTFIGFISLFSSCLPKELFSLFLLFLILLQARFCLCHEWLGCLNASADAASNVYSEVSKSLAHSV